MQILIRLAATCLPLLTASTLLAQPGATRDPQANPMPTIAAIVNGQPIYDSVIERALFLSVAPEERKAARPEFVDSFIQTAIIDQYLAALKITVDAKEVDQKVEEFKQELKKNQQDFATALKQRKMTEAELREEIHNGLRWEKFVKQQSTEEKLKALFEQMPEAFDGTTIRARHILLVPGKDAKSKEEATAKLLSIKSQIQKTVADGMAKLPPDADNVTKEKTRVQLIEEAFSNAARSNSACISKDEGGDLRWFRRYGAMVEPFSRAAFALKPYEISDVVTTSAGLHLILLVGRKVGLPVKYEDAIVKEQVKAIYESKLKDAVIDQMRPRAKIEIMDVK